MKNSKDLQDVLDAQTVASDSNEMKDLRAARQNVKNLIKAEFSDSNPNIRYGGSKSKGTMNLHDYDLDVVSYFPHDDTSAGKTIEDIYQNMQAALEKQYVVIPKNAALRIYDGKNDLRIDVVPGRYVDDTKTVATIHQREGDKDWLKTNLDMHVEHIRGSGCIPEIRLAKLWRPCAGIEIRTFPLELLVIKILEDSRVVGLENRFTYVLEQLRDNARTIAIKDPANENNDLSLALTSFDRQVLATAAANTLRDAVNNGWGIVFDDVVSATVPEQEAALQTAIITNENKTQPWLQP